MERKTPNPPRGMCGGEKKEKKLYLCGKIL